MIDRQILQRFYDERAAQADTKFDDTFLHTWLPAAGVAVTGNANTSLYAPLYPEVYVFGPWIYQALNCITHTLALVSAENADDAAAFAGDLRNTYRDDFGDIEDFDWTIYQRYVKRNRLQFTSRIDRAYNVFPPVQPSVLGAQAPDRVDFNVMLQEMLYFELLGPGMQRLKTGYLHQGAKRHAAFVTKWGLRKKV